MSTSPDNAPSGAPAGGSDGSPSTETQDDAGGHVTVPQRPMEIGGRQGLDPTRYGDWEKNGRCIDF